MKVILRFLSVMAAIVSAVWLYSDQSYEPALAMVVSLSALAAIFLRTRNRGKANQTQTVDNGSSAIQAGRDVNISVESKRSEGATRNDR